MSETLDTIKETLNAIRPHQTEEHSEKYFAFQIKGWINFDPLGKPLAKIAEGIEEGNGFVTLIEVLNVEDDPAAIADEEVRECFANILAAKRLVRTVHGLPKQLIAELRSALENEETVPKKTLASVMSLPVNGEPQLRTKFWP